MRNFALRSDQIQELDAKTPVLLSPAGCPKLKFCSLYFEHLSSLSKKKPEQLDFQRFLWTVYIKCRQQKLFFICITLPRLTLDSGKGKLTKKYIYIYIYMDIYI